MTTYDDDIVLCTFESRPGTLETPPEYCDEEIPKTEEYCPTHRQLVADLEALEELELCRCGHTLKQHQGPEGLGGAQCKVCPEDGERMWRHPFTPASEYDL